MARSLVDTNVILRYLLKDDEALFNRASGLLERVKTGEEVVVIPESVLTECVYVLLKVYKVDRLTVAEKLLGLFSYKGIANSDKKDLIDAIALFKKTQIGIVDCIVCAKAINQGLTLFTFDDDLKNIYRKKLS